MENQKVGKKKRNYSDYPLFLCQQGFKQNPTGEITFQQNDKILLLQAFILTLSTLLLTLWFKSILNRDQCSKEVHSSGVFKYLSAVLNWFWSAEELTWPQSNVVALKKICFLILMQEGQSAHLKASLVLSDITWSFI